jgi:CCR4-NOT transcriptional regulation complex NOT5 subunit
MTDAPKILWYNDQDCSAGPVQFGDGEVKYVRADLIDGVANAVETAREVFRVYQAHHEHKGDEKKAERNKFYAEQMEAALKNLESAEIGRGME